MMLSLDDPCMGGASFMAKAIMEAVAKLRGAGLLSNHRVRGAYLGQAAAC
jgi:hypothetical protein